MVSKNYCNDNRQGFSCIYSIGYLDGDGLCGARIFDTSKQRSRDGRLFAGLLGIENEEYITEILLLYIFLHCITYTISLIVMVKHPPKSLEP